MLAIIKKALHFDETETMYDDELTQYINACKADLLRSGVLSHVFIDTDPAIIDVVQSYVEFRQEQDPTKADKRRAIYNSLKTQLIVSEDYIVG